MMVQTGLFHVSCSKILTTVGNFLFWGVGGNEYNSLSTGYLQLFFVFIA